MFSKYLWPASADVPAAVGPRIRYQLDGARVEVDVVDAGGVPFEDCHPVRDFPTWRGKRHYSGLLFMQRLGAHVGFESLAERSFLMEVDRLAGVGGVSSQPMWIRWSVPNPTDHAPDFFVRLLDGSGMLVDVRPLGKIDASARAVFDRTAAVCAALSLRYVVFSAESKTRDANLRFLMRFRDPGWFVEPETEALVGFSGSLRDAVGALGGGGDALGLCFALVWSGRLDADLEVPLSLKTTVSWKDDA